MATEVGVVIGIEVTQRRIASLHNMHSVVGLTVSEHTSGHGTERIRYLSPVAVLR